MAFLRVRRLSQAPKTRGLSHFLGVTKENEERKKDGKKKKPKTDFGKNEFQAPPHDGLVSKETRPGQARRTGNRGALLAYSAFFFPSLCRRRQEECHFRRQKARLGRSSPPCHHRNRRLEKPFDGSARPREKSNWPTGKVQVFLTAPSTPQQSFYQFCEGAPACAVFRGHGTKPETLRVFLFLFFPCSVPPGPA